MNDGRHNVFDCGGYVGGGAVHWGHCVGAGIVNYRVEYWDADEVKHRISERFYDEWVLAGDFADLRHVTLRLYVDAETGIVVEDVFKFEKWIAKLEGALKE